MPGYPCCCIRGSESTSSSTSESYSDSGSASSSGSSSSSVSVPPHPCDCSDDATLAMVVDVEITDDGWSQEHDFSSAPLIETTGAYDCIHGPDYPGHPASNIAQRSEVAGIATSSTTVVKLTRDCARDVSQWFYSGAESWSYDIQSYTWTPSRSPGTYYGECTYDQDVTLSFESYLDGGKHYVRANVSALQLPIIAIVLEVPQCTFSSVDGVVDSATVDLTVQLEDASVITIGTMTLTLQEVDNA